MRYLPDDDSDNEDLKRLNVEPWMLEYLKLNPSYVSWGPGEDAMMTKDEGWSSSLELDSWKAFGPWNLDELNECVNFYFEVDRSSERCTDCGETGFNPATREIADTFYDLGDYRIDFSEMRVHGSIENARKPRGATGRRWKDAITQDEADALVAAGRLRKWTKEQGWVAVPRTAAEVNAANAEGAKYHGEMDHDAINRGILIETRAKRLGVWGVCPKCDSHGYVFTEPAGHLGVVLWMLHPRKGCSRGVRVRNLTRDDAKAATQWLAVAAQRNADRFARLLRSEGATP